MSTCVIITRFLVNTYADPEVLVTMNPIFSEKFMAQCPRLTWKESSATPGNFDVSETLEIGDSPQKIRKVAEGHHDYAKRSNYRQ